MSELHRAVNNDIKEANNKYLRELHREFINTHNLNMQDAIILSKFLEFMIEHE
jgi:hypothetical protein